MIYEENIKRLNERSGVDMSGFTLHSHQEWDSEHISREFSRMKYRISQAGFKFFVTFGETHPDQTHCNNNVSRWCFLPYTILI